MENNKTLSSNENPCQFCSAVAARYTCPRCNKLYCSVTCYQSQAHVNCSEKFYKNCCMTQLQEQGASAEEKAKVLEMLRRTAEDNEDEPISDFPDLEERLDGIDLDAEPEAVWDQLTEKERSRFQLMLKRGVDAWQPWWLKERRRVVESSEELHEHQPALLQMANPPDLKRCPAAAPSVPLHLFCVCFSYAHVTRFYNGEHHALCAEAAQLTLTSCPVLVASRQELRSAPDALQLCFSSAQSVEVSARTSLAADALCLLSDARRCAAALSDLHRLLAAARRSAEKRSTTLRQSCKQAQRKVEYLLQWSGEQRGWMKELLPALQLEIDTLREEDAAHADLAAAVKDNYDSIKPAAVKPSVIQELS